MASFGRFSGDPLTRWLSSGRMELKEDFWYEDPAGLRWDAPRGHFVDGASIPRPLWTLVGDPFGPGYRNASIVHDVYCDWGVSADRRARSWRETHRMFYYACRCGGVPDARAKLMFAAVYRFGPRWDAGLRSADRDRLDALPGAPAPTRAASAPEEEQERFLRSLEADLARNPDLSLDEIEEISG